jgi:hypothetical protein
MPLETNPTLWVNIACPMILDQIILNIKNTDKKKILQKFHPISHNTVPDYKIVHTAQQ